jgi:hypothetical protein
MAHAMRAIRSAAIAGTDETMQDAETWVKTEIVAGPKTGRLYGTHRASAPGHVPAEITGDLRDGIKRDRDTSGLRHVLMSTDRKAKWLEYGTLTMAPRPYMRPAAARIRQTLRDQIIEHLRAHIRKALR